MAMASQPLGQILKEMGKISELDIQEALQDQKARGGAIGKILSDKGLVTDEDLRIAIAKQSGMEPVNLDEIVMTSDLLDMVPAHVAETYQVIPVDFDGSVLTLALADPQNVSALDDMKFMLNVDVKGALSDATSVEAALAKYYSDRSESMESLLGSMDSGEMEVMDDSRHQMMDMDQLEKDVNAAPVVKLLNMVLLSAIKDRASDIHLEPFEKEFKIRYRVDGVLYEMMPPPIQLARAVISRVKVMSNLDIAETRLPQDGRIELNIAGRPVDLRVSTLPTMYGESVVMRVLDRGQVSLDL
ncbi:MAG TPA: pilus assembly protein PilB, partial [Planctomycetes bacterium]|nr:pilus assembly protein PilB [Planctomycetota bacterium]